MILWVIQPRISGTRNQGPMELELIRKIKELAAHPAGEISSNQVCKTIGDDCAELVPSPGKNLLVTTDTLCENVHFRLSYFRPLQLGKKLASVNLSDIAAMGGRPMWAVFNAEVPGKLADASLPFWKEFLSGLTGQLSSFNAVLVGGDTVKSPSDYLSLTLTLIGEVDSKGAVYRSGAREGDLIYCSGCTGEAACGLDILRDPDMAARLPGPVKKKLAGRHLDPHPRIALGKALAAIGINSLIDTSDGIASDLAHIAEESGLKAVVFQKLMPVSRALKVFCRTAGYSEGRELSGCLMKYVLFGGEDFELIWTVSAENSRASEKAAAQVLGSVPYRIGHMERGHGCFLDTGARRVDISFMGYEH